jgi:hypothetical protein
MQRLELAVAESPTVLALTDHFAVHEDQSRIRHRYAADNFAVLRHLALNVLQHQPIKRLSIKARRLKAGWDNAYLLKILQPL